MPSLSSIKNLELNAQLLAVFLAVILIGAGAYGAVQLIEQRYQRGLEYSLSAVIDTTAKGINLWKKEEMLMVQGMAQEESIIEAAKALLRVQREQKPLLKSKAQQRLRRMMRPNLNKYRGYFLIAPDNISLASSRDGNVGTSNLLTKYPDILEQLWSGETRLTPIQRSDVSLSTEIETLPQPGDETLFAGTPVRDEDGDIIALLTLRIDPYKTLLPLTSKGELGETGESYFFDRHGVLLSNSRHEYQLIQLGLLEPGMSSVANLRIRDPGVDLTKLDYKMQFPNNLPLTRMAASATKGEKGTDITGYRDYRGVPVVGAWQWDKELGIGLATEQDVAEAYRLFYFVKTLIYGGSTIAAMILLALAWVFISGKQSLAQLQNRLQAIVETSDYGIVVINEQGVIESINPSMESMFGYSAQEMIDNNISMLMPEPHHSQHDLYLEHYRHTGDSKIIGVGREVEGKRKDGSVFPIDLRINRLELASGLHFAGLIRDISERKQAEQGILKAREEAVHANSAKSNFLATMSHEIRTPLNGIVGTIDMLAHTSLNKDQQDLVETAQDSAVLLQGIIEDILDFSKIEAGRLELEMVPLYLEDLVEKLGENLQHIAKLSEVELLIYIDPELQQIKGDPLRLRQILYNLAGNAIKFSSDLTDRVGQVVISAQLQRRVAGKADISFQVKDNGIGMSREVQERLFRPFVQGEGEITRRFGGTGLGLVITQRLVEIMNGHIELESTEGEGSTFTVHVTLEETTELPPIETSNLEGIKVVLLTRDEAAQILSSYLRHAGATVVQKIADEAVELCKKERGDANELFVVIDTRGDMDSSTALRNTLREEISDIDQHFLFIERGQRRYARPYEKDGLTLDLNAMRRKTLLNAIAALAGRESPELQTPALIQPEPDIPLSVDEAKAQGRLILLVDDNPTNVKVIGQQLNMLGYLAETAEDGADALEMWRTGSYSLILTDCHMPIMDGYQLSEIIRREETPGTRIPIIATTADALKGTAQRCFDAGMNDYLTKPMKLQQLREALRKWAPKVGVEDESDKEQSFTQGADMSHEDIDQTALGNILGTQDPEMLAEYYNSFLETSTPTAKQIQDAFNAGDLSEVSRLAHKLKSSARTVGANRLGDCCQALEEAGREGDAQSVSQQMELLPVLFNGVKAWIEHSYATA